MTNTKDSWGQWEWAKQYQHNDLFRPAEDVLWNACVGTNGGPYQLEDYARGYFTAGASILEGLRRNRGVVDCVIYPLVFTYRHAIEISLKNLATMLPLLFDEEPAPKLTHQLVDNWRIVRGYLQKIDGVDPEEVGQIDAILNNFVQIDPGGETFRFPFDRNGSLFLQQMSHINVRVFGDAMAEAERILDCWTIGVGADLSAKRDYETEAG